MKQFLAFAYDSYYPVGGKGDYQGDFDNATTALESVEVSDYCDILDISNGEWQHYIYSRAIKAWTLYEDR